MTRNSEAFALWQQSNPGGYYNAFMFDNRATYREYECFLLDPEMALAELAGTPVMFATNDLGDACEFVYNHFRKTKQECGVWQERTKSWREVYQNDME